MLKSVNPELVKYVPSRMYIELTHLHIFILIYLCIIITYIIKLLLQILTPHELRLNMMDGSVDYHNYS